MNKAIFIDRDAVINKWIEPEDKDYGPNWYILKWEDFEFLPGVFEAFGLIYKQYMIHGDITYKPIVISNQSCVGKGYVEKNAIEDIFKTMNWEISQQTMQFSNRFFLNWYFCPHDTNQRCACRKPSPGMLYQAAIEHDIVLEDSWMIGDSGTDIQAGIAAGIPYGHCIKITNPRFTYVDNIQGKAIMLQPSLLKAVEYILSRE